MLRYFPDIFPDELLYSTFSRYYKHTGTGSVKSTYLELYGNRNVFSLVDFPYNIDAFLKQFDNTYYYTAEDIIFNNTMLPLFYPFLNKTMQIYAVNSMRNKEGKNLYKRLGVMASSISCLMNLKYCPDCMHEDIETYGEAYLHRSHNLDGIFICYKHNRFLYTNCPICNVSISPKYKYNLIPLEGTCINGHDLISSTSESNTTTFSCVDLIHHLLVSKIVNFILNLDIRAYDINFDKMHDKYIYKLFQLEYLTARGLIRQTKLKEDFVCFYGLRFLKSLKLDIDCNKQQCWLNVFLSKKYKSFHPIKHILFLLFICNNDEYEIQNLLTDNRNYNYSYNLFGNGPWPCLNPVADHYLQNVIADYSITTSPKTNMPIGIFTCSCGFIYTRHISSNPENDKCTYNAIKNLGHVWEEKLKNIILYEGGSLRSIARTMHCDPKTVIRYANKLELKYCWESHSEFHAVYCLANVKNKSKNYDYLCEQYKNVIRNYILSFTIPPRIYQIRGLYEKEYHYLYRHNRKMLNDLVKGCLSSTIKSKKKCKLNWDERDVGLFPLISNEISQLLQSEKLYRITINKIGKDLGISYILEQYLEKLPKTQSLINSSIESVEEYQKRRVRAIADKLNSNNELITKTKLLRIAGIKTSCSNEVKQEIEVLLNKYYP